MWVALVIGLLSSVFGFFLFTKKASENGCWRGYIWALAAVLALLFAGAFLLELLIPGFFRQ